MNLIIFLFLSLGLILGVEIIKRHFLLSTNITRRITHVGAALIAATSPFFLGKNIIVLFCLLFAGILFFGRRSSFFSSIHNVKRNTLGEVFLPLGEALPAIVFLPQGIREFQFGVLVMGISDALAGFIGERFGNHHVTILGNRKSIEGSFAFFISTLFLTFIFLPVFGYQLILVPLLLTLVELVLGYGLDNLALPIVAALLLKYIVF